MEGIFENYCAALTTVKSFRADSAYNVPKSVWGCAMNQTEQAQQNPGSVERVPTMQRILDNPFLLLFLGVTLPTVLYLIWGVMEIASIPLSK